MAKDILLDDDDDLLFEDGDLVVDESSDQEVGLILRSNQGDWRASPMTGFGLQQRIRSQTKRTEFARALGAALDFDGFVQSVVQLSTDGQLIINTRRNE